MPNANRTPDRLNYTKKAQEIVSSIDARKYLGLYAPNTSRSELFLFAMALGLSTNLRTRLQNAYPGGLILDSSIDSRTRSFMYAFYISSSASDVTLDDATSKESVYTTAQEYANTGFEIIADYMDTKKDTILIWTLIEELDKQYSETIDPIVKS